MKTVTAEQMLAFDWYYPEEEKIPTLVGDKQEWTALDVLRLTNMSAKVRLNVVLCPEFLEDKIMHEFACLCAEDVIAHTKHPDPRSVTGIETKRRWMRGEATDEELKAAWYSAHAAAFVATNDTRAAAETAARATAKSAECAAADAACASADAAALAASNVARFNSYADANVTRPATYADAWDATQYDTWDAADAVALVSADAARFTAYADACERQVEMLIKLLEETV